MISSRIISSLILFMISFSIFFVVPVHVEQGNAKWSIVSNAAYAASGSGKEGDGSDSDSKSGSDDDDDDDDNSGSDSDDDDDESSGSGSDNDDDDDNSGSGSDDDEDSGSNSGGNEDDNGSGSDSDDNDNSGPGSSSDGANNSGPSSGDDSSDRPKKKNQITKIMQSGPNVEFFYANGWSEKIQAGRYQVKDAKGKTVINRVAKAKDKRRVRRILRLYRK